MAIEGSLGQPRAETVRFLEPSSRVLPRGSSVRSGEDHAFAREFLGHAGPFDPSDLDARSRRLRGERQGGQQDRATSDHFTAANTLSNATPRLHSSQADAFP